MALWASQLPPSGFHANKLKSDTEPPNPLIEALADRFYVNQKAMVISNGHSTEFMCFVGDLDPKRKKYLDKKIHRVMEYATAFKDVEELNALELIPKKAPKNDYLALGFYLYLADECSRLGKKESFLWAMRKAGATLKEGDLTLAKDCQNLWDAEKFRTAFHEAANQMQSDEREDFGKILIKTSEILESKNQTLIASKELNEALKFHMLALDCTYLGTNSTFLEKAKNITAKLPAGEKWDAESVFLKTKDALSPALIKQEMFEKIEEALRIQEMKKSHGGIVREWVNTGGYTIHGKRNDELFENGKSKLRGAYARLARDVAMEQDFLGMNLPISYAMGNEQNMMKLKTEQKAYDYTKDLTKTAYKSPINPQIRLAINNGYNERVRRIKEIIHRDMHQLWDANEHQLRISEESNRALAREVFSRIPEAAREVLFIEGYNFGYASDKNISACYPDKRLEGASQKEHEICRTSLGVRHQRYRVMFISNGEIENAHGPSGEQLIIENLAKTIGHESMHMAISHLTKEEKKSLDVYVENISKEITRLGNDFPQYLYDQRYKAALDYLSEYCQQQYASGTRTEEVVCNMAGLMTKYPYPPNDGIAENPYADIKSLAPLAEKILDIYKMASERCKKKFPNEELPVSSAHENVIALPLRS